jgi:hypothetical protein
VAARLACGYVPMERWGKMGRNDCRTAWRNLKTLISSLHHYKNYACSFLLFYFLLFYLLFLSLFLRIAIYRLQVTAFLTLAGVAIVMHYLI